MAFRMLANPTPSRSVAPHLAKRIESKKTGGAVSVNLRSPPGNAGLVSAAVLQNTAVIFGHINIFRTGCIFMYKKFMLLI